MTADGMRLLVSVRSLDEAVEAISGGCDILDVKEPGRGSLGMADLREIVAVAEFAGSVGRASSAALVACMCRRSYGESAGRLFRIAQGDRLARPNGLERRVDRTHLSDAVLR